MGAILSKFREDNSTTEHDNFTRMFILVLNTTKCVRKVFDREIAPNQLKRLLKQKRLFLESKEARLTQSQLLILYPKQGGPEPTSMNFDLTLMFLLLKHLADMDCHSDKLPLESDITLKADLQRLKWYRNKIFHNPSLQIDTKTLAHDSKDIIQVIGRLDGCELIEKCKQIIFGSLKFRLNDVKFILLQLLIILHNKGCDLSRKVSEKFWSFSPIHQLRIVLSFLKAHFWIFPTMYIIWDQFQDSFHENCNAMFFQKTECQEGGYFSKYTDFLKSLSPMHVATTIGESHPFDYQCKNCPFLSKWDSEMTADQTQINIIKMICTCKKKSVKGELCYETLLAQLDLRLYTHDKEMSFDNNHFILTSKDCIPNNEGETNEGETYEARYREKVLFTKNPRVSGEEQDNDKTYTDEKMFLCQQTTPLQQLVAEEGSFVMRHFNISVLHRNHFTGYQTGYNSGLCKTVCRDQNLLN